MSIITEAMVEKARETYWDNARGRGTVEECMRDALESVADDIVEECAAYIEGMLMRDYDGMGCIGMAIHLRAVLKRNSPDRA